MGLETFDKNSDINKNSVKNWTTRAY
jgi:hypothetical protein